MKLPRASGHSSWRAGLVITAVTGLVAASGLVASAAPPVAGDIIGADSANAIADSYIVVMKPAASADAAKKTRSLVAQNNIQAAHTYSAAVHGFATTMSAAQARRLAAHPDVAFVQQNQTIGVDTTQTNPPSWGLDRVDQRSLPLDKTYGYAANGSNVHAYVIDTGIRRDHTDFEGRAVAGIDTITPGGPADDCDGHGTHVAGTIGGYTHGVAKGISLVAVRVLDCTGHGTVASVIAGVDWVTANAVKPAVANMSLGSAGNAALDAAVTNSIASGITYVVSAGNSEANACGYSPARVPAALTIGATDRYDNRASFSNFGTCTDLFAPGVNITSASNTGTTGTRDLSGTSMAAPHVAGAAALILSANPSYTPAQVSASLTAKATPSVVVDPGTGSPNRLLYVGSAPTPPPVANDFVPRAAEDTIVTTPGGSVGTDIQMTTTAGAAQGVILSAADLPAGITASFNPSSVLTGPPGCPMPCGGSRATFSVSSSTAPGQYTIAVTMTGQWVTHSLGLTLIVSDNRGTYYPVTPARILDTRHGLGAPRAPMGPGSTINLQVTGQGGVPASGVSAVVLNVTATGATAPSFVTVYPTGVRLFNASSLNLVPGWTGANSVTVGLGTGGKVNIYNNAGHTDMIADVVGFYANDTSLVSQLGVGGEYQPVIPGRLFDSRSPYFGRKVPAGGGVKVGVDFGPDVNPHIRALVVNVTAVDPSWAGYMATWNGNGPPPGTSTLNFKAGDVAVPNMAIVPVGQCCGGLPAIGVYAHADSHMIVDIMGFIDDGKLGGYRFAPLTPARILDTRFGWPAPALEQGSTVAVTARAGVVPDGAQGLALNVTAVSPTAWTYLSAWPSGIAGIGRPNVSNLNPAPGQVIPNSVYTLIGPTKAFNVYNNAGRTDVLVDVVGTFWDPEATPGGASAGRQAELSGKQQWKLIGSQSAVLDFG